MRRPLAWLIALSLLLLGAACSDDDGADDPAARADTGVDAGADEADGDGDGASLSGDVEIELLDAGQEPRRALRLRPQPGCEQRVLQRQELTQRAVAGEVDGVPLSEEALAQASEASGNSTEYDLTYRCEELDDERIAVVNRFDDVRLLAGAENQSAEAEDLIESLVGAEGRIVYDRQGRILEAEAPNVDIDDERMGPDAAAALEEMLDNLGSTIEQGANPFPDEPVGLGGRWRVTIEIDIAGLAARSVNEYTVTSIDGDRVQADVALDMEFLPGEIDFPGMPPGGSAEIVEGRATGVGTSSWDLSGIVGYTQQVIDGTLTMRITADDGSIEMTLAQRQVLALQPR